MRRAAFAIGLILTSTLLNGGTMKVLDNAGGGKIKINQTAVKTGKVSVNYGAGGLTDILFYWDMESMVSGISPNKGTGTISIGSGYTATTGVVGSGGSNNNNTANATNSRISIDSTNIDMSQGRVGFYYCQMESGAGEDGDIIYGAGTTASNPRFYLQNITGTTTFLYKDKSVAAMNSLTQNTTYFIELAWDSDEAQLGVPCRVYSDGAILASCTAGSAGSDPAPTSIRMGGLDANTFWLLHDQLIISNDPTRDLYALRNQTSF